MLVNLPKQGGDPKPYQVEAYNTLSADMQRVLQAVEAAILKVYGSSKRATSTPTPEDVTKAVELVGVIVPYARTRATFGFLFTCDWDQENGLAVKFENGELPEVGPQDIVL